MTRETDRASVSSCAAENFRARVGIDRGLLRMSRKKSEQSLNVRFGKSWGLRKRGVSFTYLSEYSGLDTAFLHALEHGRRNRA